MSEDEIAESIKTDAALFGKMQHGGNWAIALLVARNVEVGADPRHHRGTDVQRPRKISAQAFAILAGVNRRTITRYLERWDRAAEAGVVPKSHTLDPGDELGIDEMPDDNGDDPAGWWSTYKESRHAEAAALQAIEPSQIRQTMETARASIRPLVVEPTEDEVEEQPDARATTYDLGLPPGTTERRVTNAGVRQLEDNDRALAARNVTKSAEQLEYDLYSKLSSVLNNLEENALELEALPVLVWERGGEAIAARIDTIKTILLGVYGNYFPTLKETDDDSR